MSCFSNILFLSLFLLFYLTGRAENAPLKPQLVFIGIDGFSHKAMITAQKKGLFKEFQFASLVAPFPSMSDVSWNTILQTTKMFGEQGRLKSAEAVYLDESTKSVAGDVRDFYRRLAYPKYYMGGFDIFFNPYAEALMYFPTKELPKLEIKTVIDEILSSAEKPVISAFISGPDSLAHTQKDQLYPLLSWLDQELKRLVEGMKKKGLQAQVILVSDHGNQGRFDEGQPEIELFKIDLARDMKKYGFHFANSLENNNDVAVPLLALGSWAPVYFKNQNLRKDFLKKLAHEKWFDLGLFILEQNQEKISVALVTPQGEAELTYDKVKNLFTWKILSGNVFGIASFADLSEDQTHQLALASNYPDAFSRIRQAVLNKNFDFPDLLLTSKDGYCFDNSLSQYTKMYRTHGSLSAGSSLGLVASNFKTLPESLTAENVLNHFDLAPEKLYQKTLTYHRATAEDGLKQLKSHQNSGLATNIRELSAKDLFQIITRFVADTRPFFLVSELKEFFSSLSFSSHPIKTKNPIKPEDIGRLADLLLQNPELQKFRNQPDTKAILNRAENQIPFNTKNDFFQSGGSAVQSKRLAMKIFQIPPLIERALTLPERTQLAETRDVDFATYWLSHRESLILSPYSLSSQRHQKTISEKLFSQAFTEALLEERLFPNPLQRVYKQQLKNVTLVYVPGIYNSLFDKEIFSLGIKKLEEDFSLRVIQAPTESACSAQYNGQVLMRFLKDDFFQRQQRLGSPTRYLILGYSKGAVDALSGFVIDREFVSKNILGLLSIASPLQGSSILNRTDLPLELVEALSSRKAPEACAKESTAGKSVTPMALARFWRLHGSSLIGLTRYLSLSFVSEIENSHLLMKATKLLAQFDEENDGVVSLSSSRFPGFLNAVDLGKVNADHLAGVLSSKFDQKSFFQAIAVTLAELNIDDETLNLRWNIQQILNQVNKTHYTENVFLKDDKGPVAIYRTKNLVFRKKIMENVKNSYEANQFLLPPTTNLTDNYLPQVSLPENQLGYEPYKVLDLKSLSSLLEKFKVTPLSPQQFPNGVRFEVKQKNIGEFRIDHQFNYENTSPPEADDNEKDGNKIVPLGKLGSWLRMKSSGTSIRMTTMAYRFRPVDFPKFSTLLYVTKPVEGAEVSKGGSGKDDSAFQVWIVLRVGNATGNRSIIDASKDKTVLFGYYWGTPTSNQEKQAGQIFENYFSQKNYVAVSFPETKQLLLENPGKLNQPVEIQRNFAEDLKKSFPDLKVENLEVLAITFQQDSNDTKNESEIFLKNLNFEK